MRFEVGCAAVYHGEVWYAQLMITHILDLLTVNRACIGIISTSHTGSELGQRAATCAWSHVLGALWRVSSAPLFTETLTACFCAAMGFLCTYLVSLITSGMPSRQAQSLHALSAARSVMAKHALRRDLPASGSAMSALCTYVASQVPILASHERHASSIGQRW